MCKDTYGNIQVSWCTRTMASEILDILDICQVHVKVSSNEKCKLKYLILAILGESLLRYQDTHWENSQLNKIQN